MADDVSKFITESLGIGSDDASLGKTLESLEIDSLDFAELLMEVEEKFSIELAVDEIDDKMRVSELIETVKKAIG